MASLCCYKGMCIVDSMPSGGGGCAIQKNFKTLTDRIGPCYYTATVDPDEDDDGNNSGGTGIYFTVGSQWLNTNDRSRLWVCVDNSTGAAKWSPIEEWESSVTPTGDKIVRRNASGNLCAANICSTCCIYASRDVIAATGSVCAGNNVCTGYTVHGYCGCFYKLDYTTSDPSLVLYYPESRNAIVGLAKGSIPPERSNGAVLFYNKDTSAFEVYKMDEGKFCSMFGELLETLPDPEIASDDEVEEVYRFDARTGTVVKRQRLRLERTRLKRGYAVDPVSGKILREEDGTEIELSEAVESRRPREAQSLAEKIVQRQQKKKTQ